MNRLTSHKTDGRQVVNSARAADIPARSAPPPASPVPPAGAAAAAAAAARTAGTSSIGAGGSRRGSDLSPKRAEELGVLTSTSHRHRIDNGVVVVVDGGWQQRRRDRTVRENRTEQNRTEQKATAVSSVERVLAGSTAVCTVQSCRRESSSSARDTVCMHLCLEAGPRNAQKRHRTPRRRKKTPRLGTRGARTFHSPTESFLSGAFLNSFRKNT